MAYFVRLSIGDLRKKERESAPLITTDNLQAEFSAAGHGVRAASVDLKGERPQPVQRRRAGELHLRCQGQPHLGRDHSCTYSSENLLTSDPGGVTLGYDPAMRLSQVAGASTTVRL